MQPEDEARSVRVSTSRYGHDGVADAIPGEQDIGNVDPKRRLSYTPTHSKKANPPSSRFSNSVCQI